MKSISSSDTKNCIGCVLLIVILMSGKTSHCGAQEAARQAKITAFFTAAQAKKKQLTEEDSTQLFLDGGASRERAEVQQRKHNKSYTCRLELDAYKEESEQKGDNAISLPIGTLARASVRQRRQNKALTSEIKTALRTAGWPEDPIKIVKDYARPEWFLRQKVRHQSDRIYNFVTHDNLPDDIVSYSDSGTKQEAAAWQKATGTLISISPNAIIHYKARPEESGFLEQTAGGFTDFASSPDGQKVAFSAFDQGQLYILPSGLTFGQAMAKGQEVIVRNQKHGQVISQEQLQQNPFMSVAFSPCSKHILAGGADGVMHLMTTTGEPLYHFDHGAAVTAITTSSDGNTVYAGLENGGVAVWQKNPIPPSATFQLNAPDGPQTASMHDEDISSVRSIGAGIAAHPLLCTENNFACVKNCLQCCLGPNRGLACGACCCNGASCIKYCPGAAAVCCYISSKQLYGRLVGSIKRLWQ